MNYTERIPVPQGYVSVVEVMRGTWTVTAWQLKPDDERGALGMDRNFFLVLRTKTEAVKLARRMARARWKDAAQPMIEAPPRGPLPQIGQRT